MLKHRVIPCLLLRNEGLVKTNRFRDPKYVGDPINAIRIFNDKEVDELMVIDINATKEGKEPQYHLIEQFAGECFMPLCYGGGVSTVEQAHRLFSLGVEKICLQTAALENPALIGEIAARFGSQSVLVSIDVKKNWLGKRQVYASARHKSLSIPLPELLKQMVDAGAGEIVLNSVDQDGVMNGMDLELIREVSALLSVPLIAVGGVGSLEDIRRGIEAGASAVAAGAFFVFHGPHKAVLITYPKYSQLENLMKNIYE
jgi:cyclase